MEPSSDGTSGVCSEPAPAGTDSRGERPDVAHPAHAANAAKAARTADAASAAHASRAPRPRVAVVPRLEARFRIRRRLRDDGGRWALALDIDARLAWRTRMETRIERARAALARRLLECRPHEAAGYSHLRDYAREELGLSLRALQDLARIDRALEKLPRFEAEIGAGRMPLSRVLAVLPVVCPESEELWLAQARKRTHRELVRRVRIAKETRGDKETSRAAKPEGSRAVHGGDSPSASTPEPPPADEAEALLLQRKPSRSQFLWEAFVEESSRKAGRNVSQGEALEILLAEFWPLVPREALDILPRRVQPPRRNCPTTEQPGVIPLTARQPLDEDDVAAQDLDPWGDPGHWTLLKDPDGLPLAQNQTDGENFVMRSPNPRFGNYRERLDWFEKNNASWKDSRSYALHYARELLQKGISPDLPQEDQALLDLSGLDRLSARELETRFLALRAYQRRLSVDQGALLLLVRSLRLHGALDFASFGHYTRERLGITRRTADHRADFHQLLCREPVLRKAYCRDQLADSTLPHLRRLIEMGVRGRALRPWVRRAGLVPSSTFRDMVRWIEARRDGWWRRATRGHSDAASGTGSAGAGEAGSLPISGLDSAIDLSPCPTLPPTFWEWTRARRLLNASPEALASVAAGCLQTEQMSARTGEKKEPAAAEHAGSTDAEGHPTLAVSAASPTSAGPINPLFPSIDEPASKTCRLYAPLEVIDSYFDAIEAVRIIYGDNKPAWWCLEIMMLHVRRDWAQESRYCRRNVEHYDIFERDGFCCCCPGCTHRSQLEAHHAEFRSRGGSNRPENLVTTCRGCHQFGIHRAGIIRVRGRAPHRLIWELGRIIDEHGRVRPRRRYVGEFRRDAR